MPLTLPRRDSNEAPRLELDQGWEFLPDFEAKVSIANLPAEGWRAAQVAIGWNAQFDDLRDYLGVGWYRCLVDIPQYSDPRHVLVRFGAVDYFAEVFMNGKLVGSHEGGYTPFVIDATSAVKPGVNELVVRVIDPPMDEPRNLLVCPEMMYHEIPHGKQNWYVQNAGIWQGVRIELAPAIYIETIRVTPHVGGDFRVDVALAGVGLIDQSLTSNTDLSFTVTDRSGRQILADTLPLVSAEMQSFRGTISKPQLWNLHDPALYTLEVRVRGAVSYRKRVRFGFRKFEAKHGKLYLNDQPFYMRGALDQDFYPETIHTPSSEDYVRELMLKAKRLGINILRCHLKIAHPVYLTVADEVGMLLWTEVPSWSDCWYPSDHFSLKAADRGRRMFEEMIERDWNHPSIVIQTIMNESWGIDLNDSTQRTWLKNTFNWVKEELAPIGRLVIDNSACEKNFHMKSDIEDFHNYYSMPDQADRWEKWTTELAARPDWTFSPHGDGERTGEEPIIVSEFGNWGLALVVFRQLWRARGNASSWAPQTLRAVRLQQDFWGL
jgi:beta-galactosidase/beta-glucuronidase